MAGSGSSGMKEMTVLEVESFSSRDGYRDMEDFIALVRDARARDLLERAIAGRGAIRRFKDTLFEFPDLRETWFRFHDVRTERRAIEWLRDQELIDENEAARALSERAEDPAPPSTEATGGAPPVDPFEVAGEVARDLAALYGERLRGVYLFGSWARGDAHPESDLDLLVVLDRIDSSWGEVLRMEPVLERRSDEHGTVVIAMPVSVSQFDRPSRPALIRAKSEGQRVA